MSQKRLLLLHEDRILGDLLREKLEMANFTVNVARSADAGLKIGGERRPDAVVLDPLLPGTSPATLIPSLRALGGEKPLPVIALPASRQLIADNASEAGATVMPRGTNLLADLLDTVQSALDLGKISLITKSAKFQADENWLKTSLNAAPDRINALRRSLHELSRNGGDPEELREFLRLTHGLSEQMSALEQQPLHQFICQIEAVAFDLVRFPDQLNPSILRTLGQAIDFLPTLLSDTVRNRLKNPSEGQILVVDDEEGARKIIMAAMRVANLRSMAADTPSSGLSALGVEDFGIIFLDVGLPEMNGFDLCQKIRSLPMHERTPIVFITGMATFQNRVQSNLSGGNDFVGKPFSITELGLKALYWMLKGQLSHP